MCPCNGSLLTTYERYVTYEWTGADVQYTRPCPCTLCPECGGLTREPVDEGTADVFRGMERCGCA